MLPWRENTHPYAILLSEIMLQQTQVDRVIPKFRKIMEAYPDVSRLANASLSDLLTLWQGMGYNRRARYLILTAQRLVQNHKAMIPESIDQLISLPGIGLATAAAIVVYAFNKPQVFIETNIRSVFLYHFFKNQKNIDDKQLFPYIEETLDRNNPRRWYWALMDYGSYVKKTFGNPNKLSSHFKKQAPFKDSNRYVRGVILRLLLKNKYLSQVTLEKQLNSHKEKVGVALDGLLKDAIIKKDAKGNYSLES